MLDTLLAWYGEPLFWLFPVATMLLSAVVFMVFALPLTWIAARDVAWARPYRIQSRPPREQQLVEPSIKAGPSTMGGCSSERSRRGRCSGSRASTRDRCRRGG
jgi:hypothetical protein